MTLGPLHLVVVGFESDKVISEIGQQLENVRRRGIIRLFDFLYILKRADGTVVAKEISDLNQDEKHQFGGVIKNLIGMVANDADKLRTGEIGDELTHVAEADFGLDQDELTLVAEKIPNGSSAILLLFEHRWAVGLKQALIDAGGRTILQGLISPESLNMAGTELKAVVAAAQRLEESALADAMAIISQAEQAKAEALAEAEVIMGQAEVQKATAEALRQAAEQERAQADEVYAAAQLVKGKALDDAREIVTASKAVKEVAAADVVETLVEAQAVEEAAMRRAAAVMDAADEAEARAIMRAVQALLTAEVIQQNALEDAVNAIVAAQIVESVAAERAAAALLSGYTG